MTVMLFASAKPLYRFASAPVGFLSISREPHLVGGSIHGLRIDIPCDDLLHILTLRTVITHRAERTFFKV